MIKQDFPLTYVVSRSKSSLHNRRIQSRLANRQFTQNLNKVCQSQERTWLKSRGKARSKEFGPLERTKLRMFFNELDSSKTGSINGDDLYLPYVSVGLVHSREEVTDLLTSAKFGPDHQLSFDDLITLIRDGKSKEGQPVLFNFFQELVKSGKSVTELPLSLFLSNKRRQFMMQAFTSESADERRVGSKILKAFATELKHSPDPRRPIRTSSITAGRQSAMKTTDFMHSRTDLIDKTWGGEVRRGR